MKGLDLSFLKKKVQDIQKDCVDYVSDDVGYNAYTNNLSLRKEKKSFEVGDFAFSQMCTKIGVPVRYMKKCMKEGKIELVDDNISDWMGSYKKPFLIRTYKDKVRGVLSDKYSLFDSHEILETMEESSLDLSDYNLKEFFTNEENFHIRLTQKEMLEVKGEDLFAGAVLTSSDVGKSTLTLNFFLFKQVCSNGLIVPRYGGILFQQKHIGIKREDFKKGLEEGFEEIPLVAEKVKESIERSRNTSIDLKSNIEEVKAMLKEEYVLSNEHIEKVLHLTENVYTPTNWGLLNSLTEVAQELSFDRRIELETRASKLLVA